METKKKFIVKWKEQRNTYFYAEVNAKSKKEAIKRAQSYQIDESAAELLEECGTITNKKRICYVKEENSKPFLGRYMKYFIVSLILLGSVFCLKAHAKNISLLGQNVFVQFNLKD